MTIPDIGSYLPISDRKVVIDATALPGPGLSDLLLTYNGGQPLVISEATRELAATAVTVSGKADFLNVSALDVKATVTVNAAGNEPILTVRFALIADQPGPNSWRFSQSFKSLPISSDNKGAGGNSGNFLDRLVLSSTRFILTTADGGHDEVTGAPLVAGLNFAAHCRTTGLFGLLGMLLGGVAQFTLYGPIILPKPTEVTLPAPVMPLMKFPWQVLWPIPGIHLQADLGIDHEFFGSKLRFHDVGLRIYYPPSQTWADANPSYPPLTAAVCRLDIPSASMVLDLTAFGLFSLNQLSIFGLFQGVTLGTLANLADIAGGSDLFDHLPEELKRYGEALKGISLEAVTLQLGKDLSVQTVGVAVGIPNINSTILPGFTVQSLLANFSIADPFGANRSVEVNLGGRIALLDAPLDVSIDLPEIAAHALLVESTTLPLNDWFSSVGLPAPPDLVVNALEMSVSKDGSYVCATTLAKQPPWTLELGPVPLTISDVQLLLTRPVGGAASGTFGGILSLGDEVKLMLTYQTPGDFIIRSDVPEVQLLHLIGGLTNQTLLLPGGFDLTFTDSSVLIEKNGENLVFRFATRFQDTATVAFEARRVSNSQATQNVWGFAVGIDLAELRPSTLPGLNALAAFENFFRLDELLLLVSSFDDPGFTFPSLAAFNSPVISSGSLKLPVQAGGVVAGLNLYARWTLDTSKQQSLLRSLLGLNPSIGITLQIGEDPAQNSRLYVTYTTKIQGHPLTCEFGGQIKDGNIGIFLIGSITVDIQEQPQEFDVTLLIVENGAFISATVKGTSPIVFKYDDIEVFQLGNLAFELGIDWELVPSVGVTGTIAVVGFESSIAVFFDTANPSQSLVAGSMSNLTLKDVVDTLAGTIIPSDIDAVLDMVAIKGTQQFMIPGDLASDLDNLHLDRVVIAFASAGKIQIPSSSSQVLLVVATRGASWYLTDMTTMRHYQLRKIDNNIQVSVEAQVYCSPQETFIGSIPFHKSFYLNGSLNFFGFSASATIVVNPNQGIAIDGGMDRIVIGTESLFAIEKARGEGGPQVSAATFPQPAQADEQFRSPHFYINGAMRMLGVSRVLYIRLTKTGFEFDLSGNLVPAVNFDVHGSFFGPTDLDVGGGLQVGIDTIDLGPLGKITLKSDVSCTMNVNVHGTQITATLEASFEFAAQSYPIPKYDLDVNAEPLKDLPAALRDKVKDILNDLFKDAQQWANYVAKGFIEGIDDMEKVLQDVYHKTVDEAKQIADTARQAAQEVAKACAMTTATMHL